MHMELGLLCDKEKLQLQLVTLPNKITFRILTLPLSVYVKELHQVFYIFVLYMCACVHVRMYKRNLMNTLD